MVCYTHSNSRLQQGSGLMDSLLRPFTVSKYGNEMHSRSLDPNHFLQGYTFNGPKTEILLREKLGDNIPLNDLDRAAKEHDYAYLREKSEYEKDHNKQKHINNTVTLLDNYGNQIDTNTSNGKFAPEAFSVLLSINDKK